ncbi:MAG: hypothetical protein Q7W30_09720 [Coriobacteriia bacterium]|nr:hypothetical protein [Coriobacteriia bacterium]
MEQSAAVQSIPLILGLGAIGLIAAYAGVWVIPEKLGQPPTAPQKKRFAMLYMGVMAAAIVAYVVLALLRVI